MNKGLRSLHKVTPQTPAPEGGYRFLHQLTGRELYIAKVGIIRTGILKIHSCVVDTSQDVRILSSNLYVLTGQDVISRPRKELPLTIGNPAQRHQGLIGFSEMLFGVSKVHRIKGFTQNTLLHLDEVFDLRRSCYSVQSLQHRINTRNSTNGVAGGVKTQSTETPQVRLLDELYWIDGLTCANNGLAVNESGDTRGMANHNSPLDVRIREMLTQSPDCIHAFRTASGKLKRVYTIAGVRCIESGKAINISNTHTGMDAANKPGDVDQRESEIFSKYGALPNIESEDDAKRKATPKVIAKETLPMANQRDSTNPTNTINLDEPCIYKLAGKLCLEDGTNVDTYGDELYDNNSPQLKQSRAMLIAKRLSTGLLSHNQTTLVPKVESTNHNSAIHVHDGTIVDGLSTQPVHTYTVAGRRCLDNGTIVDAYGNEIKGAPNSLEDKEGRALLIAKRLSDEASRRGSISAKVEPKVEMKRMVISGVEYLYESADDLAIILKALA